MGLAIEYVRDGEGVYVIGEGAVTGQDLIAVNHEIYQPERLSRQKYQIVDFTAAQEAVLTADETHQIALQDMAAAEINPGFIIAVVVKGDDHFGLARMWEAFVDGSALETKLFRDRESAEAWVESVLSRE